MLEERIASLAISEPPEIDRDALMLQRILTPGMHEISEEVSAIMRGVPSIIS